MVSFARKPCCKQGVCATVCTRVPPVLQAGSDSQPEKENFKPGTALEFRQLNYLNIFKLPESLWKAGLFYHLSFSWDDQLVITTELLKSSQY